MAGKGHLKTWTAKYTLTKEDVGCSEQSPVFTIKYSDLSRNPGRDVRATTDGSAVRIDTISPTIPKVHFQSNNENPKLAQLGDKVSLTMTTSEDVLPKSMQVCINVHSNTSNSVLSHLWPVSHKCTWCNEGTWYNGVGSQKACQDKAVAQKANFYTYKPNTKSCRISAKDGSCSSTGSGYAKCDGNVHTKPKGRRLQRAAWSNAGKQVHVNKCREMDISGSKRSWVASYYLIEGDDEMCNGTKNVDYNVTYSDLTGLFGKYVSSTTDQSSVAADSILPVLSGIRLVSSNKLGMSNGTSEQRAKAGDILTLSFAASETLMRVNVTMLHGKGKCTTPRDAKVTYDTKAKRWIATYKVVGQDGACTGQKPTFKIVYMDLSNNKGIPRSSTTDNTNVIMDVDKSSYPTLTSVNIRSSNTNCLGKADPGRAIVGDVITLSLTASEPLLSLGITLLTAPGCKANRIVNTVYDKSRLRWVGKYTLLSADLACGLRDGKKIDFTTSFKDMTSNPGGPVTVTTDKSQVLFDSKMPSLTYVSFKTNNADKTFAKEGDVLTLTMRADAALLQNSVNVTMLSGLPAPSKGNQSQPSCPSSVGCPVKSEAAYCHLNRTATVAMVSKDQISWTGKYKLTGKDLLCKGSKPSRFRVVFSDRAGQLGEVVATTDKTAVVVDTVVPQLKNLSIGTSNSHSTGSTGDNSTGRARVGDKLTLTITATETLLRVSMTMMTSKGFCNKNRAAKVVNVKGSNVWVGTYVVAADDSDCSHEHAKFAVAYADLAGNKGVIRTDTTDGTGIMLDLAREPYLSAVSIASNNAFAKKHATVGDMLTITFTAHEQLLASSIKVLVLQGTGKCNNVRAAKIAMVRGNRTWTAKYVVVAGDSGCTSQTPGFTITYTDLAGNPGAAAKATKDGSAVYVDATTPLLKSVTILSNNANPKIAKVGDKITLTVVASEDLRPGSIRATFMRETGFRAEVGACRDRNGRFGRHIYAYKKTRTECRAACDAAGKYCEAFNFDPDVNGVSWCGVFGEKLSVNHLKAIQSIKTSSSTKFIFGQSSSGGSITRGDTTNTTASYTTHLCSKWVTCYLRNGKPTVTPGCNGSPVTLGHRSCDTCNYAWVRKSTLIAAYKILL